MVYDITASLTIESVKCGNCGTVFGLESTFHEARKRDGKSFYCPNGHYICYGVHDEIQRLRNEVSRTTARLDQAKADADYQRQVAERERKRTAAARGQVTRIRNRVQAGVCPCCNRHFTNLERHMATKHPETPTPAKD